MEEQDRGTGRGGERERKKRVVQKKKAFLHFLIFCEVYNFGLSCLLPLLWEVLCFHLKWPHLVSYSTEPTEPTEDRNAWGKGPWSFADSP